jgi:hypothetical protein
MCQQTRACTGLPANDCLSLTIQCSLCLGLEGAQSHVSAGSWDMCGCWVVMHSNARILECPSYEQLELVLVHRLDMMMRG